jgi:uncharacterized protein YfkK (UPF0435 family)
MLEKLFISKVRIKIIELYVNQPKSEFHVRGLMRELNEEINSVRRELKNLESIGFLKANVRGNKLVYKCNRNHIFFTEFKQLILKDNDSVQIIWKYLKGFKTIKIAFLTEDFFTDSEKTNESVDLVIIGAVKQNDLQIKLNQIEKKLGKELNVALFTNEDFDFHMKKKSTFLNNILQKEKTFLTGESKDFFRPINKLKRSENEKV